MFNRVDYRIFGEIEIILKIYVDFYNNIRLHGLLGRITPREKRNQDKYLILLKPKTYAGEEGIHAMGYKSLEISETIKNNLIKEQAFFK